VIESYIKKIFDSDDPSLVADILRAIDKITKKPKTEILKEYQEKGYKKDNLEAVLKFSELKGDLNEIRQKIKRMHPDWETKNTVHFRLAGLDELGDIYWGIKSLQNMNNVRINFGIVRGLDYYTNFVFEVFDTTLDIGSLVGGGRYDSLPATFGRTDLGATGVAGGVERIVLSLENQNLPKNLSDSRISILYTDREMQENARILTSEMRQLGLLVDTELWIKPLKKQMELAANSKFAVIVGPKEYADGNVVLRNMNDRTEKIISIKELLENSSEYLS